MNGIHKKMYRNPEQLLLDFAQVTHIPTTYINNTLSAVGTPQQISGAVDTLLEDLEAASAIASKKLNSLVDDMLRTAPRLGYDVEVLRGSLQQLHTQISKTEPKRDILAEKGETAIHQLAMLEQVKSKMIETQKIFIEARAWNPPESIEETIGDLIAAKQVSAASQRAIYYEGLLQVYKGTSEYARRKGVLERVQKKLLAIKQDGSARKSSDVARKSGESHRSGDTASAEEGYYSSFIKRAFKT